MNHVSLLRFVHLTLFDGNFDAIISFNDELREFFAPFGYKWTSKEAKPLGTVPARSD